MRSRVLQQRARFAALLLPLAILFLAGLSPGFAQSAPPVGSAAPPPAAGSDLRILIGNLSSLDYATRTNAARRIRRAPAAEAVPALAEAVRRHPDEYARNRAFILLTAFNDKGTPELASSLLRDRNDRVRETAYKWLEQHPDPKLTPTLLAALQTETAEFVRPALVGALAAVDQDPQVRRALVSEVGRGLDFFRSAVIDALGRHHAVYAVDAIAPITMNEGPLQQDAVLAIGRIGGPRADAILAAVTGAPQDVQLTARAATCLAGKSCDAQITALSSAAAATGGRPASVRAAVAGLAVIAESGNAAALRALLDLPGRVPAVRDDVAIGFSSLALRRPAAVLDWLDDAAGPARNAAIELLKDGFDALEDDYAEEQFFAATRAMYWQAADDSPTRTVMAALIQQLEF